MTEKEFLIKLEKVHGNKYSLIQHHPFTSSINKITLKLRPFFFIFREFVLGLNSEIFTIV